MLRRRLERRGYAVSTAADGVEALESVRAACPDLLLLDLSLPRLDGWDVARELRTEQRFHDLPIVALTAHAMRGERERALGAGCDAFATKPVDFAALVATIDHLLSGLR
ncbi:MAG: response regulator [Deltaproteobacteria bacterium]|nr:response regulator [Deltaproteobacteria bacterium]MCB9786651.1 response regulator [Deltaproteobacteria bacterium]